MKSKPPQRGARKVFRVASGLSIDQQLQIVSQLQTEGDDVLQAIRRIKDVSNNQKQATKSNNLKFEWLQDHSRLKKLEETLLKELESLLLRMYSEASTLREFKTSPKSESNNGDIEGHVTMPLLSTSTIYAAELEDLVRTEQLNRVDLINQITSEREQRVALKQLLSAVQGPDTSEDMENNVRQLVYDAVSARQMIEATLEEEVQSCEKEFDACYRELLETLRDGVASLPLENLHDEEAKRTAVLEAIGWNECPDKMLRLEISQDIRQVFTTLQTEFQQFHQEFLTAASANDAAGSMEAALDKCGGWNESDEERFVNVLRSYEKKFRGGNKPQLLYDQLALVLPHVSLVEIKKHVNFHHHVRYYHDKRRDRQRDFERRVETLQSDARGKIRLAQLQEQEMKDKMQQLSEIQQQCEQKHELLNQWRVTQRVKAQLKTQQQDFEQTLEAQKREDQALRWRQKLRQQKISVEEYKKGKALEVLADDRVKLDEKQRLEEERASRRPHQAERVQYRHEEHQRKLENLNQEKVSKAQLEVQRLTKLNELKETLPYAQIVANITPNAERTRQETAAFRATIDAIPAGLAITETGLFPTHGYDCETLFKNARFKLGVALRNAGLNSSEFARNALSNVKVWNAGAYRNHVAPPTKLW